MVCNKITLWHINVGIFTSCLRIQFCLTNHLSSTLIKKYFFEIIMKSSKAVHVLFLCLLIKWRRMVISADSQAETGTENSKRSDVRSMFPFCTCSHQSEHINTPCRLTPNTDASDQKMLINTEKEK